MTSTSRGFTLLELLTVIGMIALIMGAMTVAVRGAQERARIQKATADVKSITQAVLGFENYKGTLAEHTMSKADVEKSSIGFILGDGGTSKYDTKIPVLLMASLTSGGKMLDPWGTPYRITIHKGVARVKSDTATSSMATSYVVPNYYNLSKEERQ